jgi:hypothetical protein
MEIELLIPAEPAESPQALATRPCTAESAECTCPDFCERDHEND